MRREKLALALLTMIAALVLGGCGESKPPLVPDPDPAASSDGGATATATPRSTSGTATP
ncbi:MAG TPA: hypothetical protein VLM85_31025 [Polyangiaceae bacterium]|nr:hypothetical protein [Polyangiaceae bacterium]